LAATFASPYRSAERFQTYAVSITAPLQLRVDPTLTAVASTGNMQFTHWSGCPSSSGATCTVTMSAAVNVTANFSPSLDCYGECFADCYPDYGSSYCSSFCNNVCN
jgi:hypothetical protein